MTISEQRRLGVALQRLVEQRCRPGVAIDRIDVRRLTYSSSYDAHVITMSLDTGETWNLFHKNLTTSRVPKQDPEQRRERELHVYRDLLADADLGTPEYYGSAWDDTDQYYWLFLEYVSGRPLIELDQEWWVLACAWLARLHGHFSQQMARFEGHTTLARHDVGFYQRTLERSRRQVALAAPDLLPRWTAVAEAVDARCCDLAAQRMTLVHGDYNPRNILVASGGDLPRVSPVDWERSAVGSAYFDMAMLMDGFDSEMRETMFAAYRQEAANIGYVIPSDTEMGFYVDCFRIFRIVTWLSRAHDRRFSWNKVAALIAAAETQSPLCLQRPIS